MNNTELLLEYRRIKPIYESFCMKINLLMEDLLKSNNIEYNSINYRVKDEVSLEKKLLRKKSILILNR